MNVRTMNNMKTASPFRLHSASILIALAGFLSGQTAYAAPCSASTVHTYEANFSQVIDDPSDNQTGNWTDIYAWSQSQRYGLNCACTTATYPQTYYTAVVPGTKVAESTIDGRPIGFYALANTQDALAVGSAVMIGGTVGNYIPTPFNSFPNGGDQNGNPIPCRQGVMATTGSQGVVYLYFRRPFVGALDISATLMELYAATEPGEQGNMIASVHMTGHVEVNQSCSMNETIIPINFGDISANDIKTLGQRPASINKEVTISIECKNVTNEAFPRYSLTLDGQTVVSDASVLATSNEAVGIVIEDVNNAGNRVSPALGKIVMTPLSGSNTDLQRQTAAQLNTYPINVTGNMPETGEFTGTATVKLEFE